ncbi:alpha/beta fold hydrolase [Streptomyces sp. NPDC055036]
MKTYTFPQLTAVTLGALLASGVSYAAYAGIRSRTFRHSAFTEHRISCETGNLITYYRRDGLPGGPTVVFESGLMGSSTSWLLLADHLDAATSVVVYDRAGYRKSLRSCTEEYCLSESVDDLREVIADAVVANGPVFLAGHSLGGYLCYQVAGTPSRNGESRMPEPAVDGVILVDPTHPRELMESRRQRLGSGATHMTLKLGPLTSLLGGGLLADRKNLFAYCAGSPYEKPLWLEGSAASTWRAARREWQQSYTLMLDGGRQLNTVAVPVTVIAAEETLRSSAEQRSLYDEYISLGTGGEMVSIAGASHMSIVASVEHAPATAAELEKVIAVWTKRADSAKSARRAASDGDEASKAEVRK